MPRHAERRWFAAGLLRRPCEPDHPDRPTLRLHRLGPRYWTLEVRLPAPPPAALLQALDRAAERAGGQEEAKFFSNPPGENFTSWRFRRKRDALLAVLKVLVVLALNSRAY